jgi:hypothetical protein
MDCSTAPETRRRIEAVIAGLEDPDHKRMLSVWLRHWWGEVTYDIEACIDTLTETASYRWYGTDQIGDGVHEDSAAFAQGMYQSMFDAGLMPGGPFDEERWAFGDWGLTLQAVFTSVFPGAMLKGASAQPDHEGLYLVQWPMVVAHPFDLARGLMQGELMYAGPPLHIEPADAGTIRRLLGREG